MTTNNYVGNIWIQTKELRINEAKLPENNGSAYQTYHMGLIVNKRNLLLWGRNVQDQVYDSTNITFTTTPTYNTIPHYPLINTSGTVLTGLTGLALQTVIDQCVIEKLIIGGEITIILVNYGAGYSKKAYVRGWNDQGQGGNGLTTNISRLRYFSTPTTINDIFCGAPWIGTNACRTTLIVDGNGNLWETGRRASQAGASTTTTPVALPVLPNNAKVVKALSTASTIIALGDDSYVYAIGQNGATYQFGNLTTTNSTTAWVNVLTDLVGPSGNAPLSGVIDIYQGGTLATATTWYALTVLGQIYSWGLNPVGQCGHGNLTQPTTSKKVMRTISFSITGIVSFACSGGWNGSASTLQACAITSTGRMYTWGSGGEGDGQGTALDQSYATEVTSIAYDQNVGSGIGTGNVATTASIYGVLNVWGKVFSQGTVEGFFVTTTNAYGNELYHLGNNAMGQAGTGDSVADHTYFTRVPFQEGVSEVWCHGYYNTTAADYNVVAFVKGVSGRMYVCGGNDGFDAGNVPYTATATENIYTFKEFIV